MKRSAWCTITGKVYVSEDEIRELVEAGFASVLSENDTIIENEAAAFEHLAREKLSALFPTDDPFKFNEVSVDLHSLR